MAAIIGESPLPYEIERAVSGRIHSIEEDFSSSSVVRRSGYCNYLVTVVQPGVGSVAHVHLGSLARGQQEAFDLLKVGDSVRLYVNGSGIAPWVEKLS